MWQGVTEGNLERVLDLLKAMSPIAVLGEAGFLADCAGAEGGATATATVLLQRISRTHLNQSGRTTIAGSNSPCRQRCKAAASCWIHASALADRLSSLETATAGDFTQRPRELFRRSPENDR
jgi:hypothetical protein